MLHSPQVEPISNLCRDHVAVLKKLKKGPVFLARRGSLAVALVSIEEWDKITARLEHAETLLRALHIHDEMNSDPSKSIFDEELMQRLATLEAITASLDFVNIAPTAASLAAQEMPAPAHAGDE